MDSQVKGIWFGSGSGVAVPKPCLLDFFILASGASGTVALYDGLDKTSGRKIAYLAGTSVQQTIAVNFGGVWLTRGLYVEVIAGTPSYSVVYHFLD